MKSNNSRSSILLLLDKHDRSVSPESEQFTINFLIDNPICCGYLTRFCESQFNSENLNFLLAVDKLNDKFISEEDQSHLKSLEELDSIYLQENKPPLTESKEEYHFSIPRHLLKIEIQSIWDDFLSDHSPNQICVPGKVYQRTLRRIDHFAKYGPSVFNEACFDPIKTMRSDILPRFLVSLDCRILREKLNSISVLPKADEFQVSPPSRSREQFDLANFDPTQHFTLSELTKSYHLYMFFSEYLVSSHSLHALHCVRIISIFLDFFYGLLPRGAAIGDNKDNVNNNNPRASNLSSVRTRRVAGPAEAKEKETSPIAIEESGIGVASKGISKSSTGPGPGGEGGRGGGHGESDQGKSAETFGAEGGTEEIIEPPTSPSAKPSPVSTPTSPTASSSSSSSSSTPFANRSSLTSPVIRDSAHREELQGTTGGSSIDELAWAIYLYFLAPGAVFEIPMEVVERKKVERSLASPHRDMFNSAMFSAHTILKKQYDQFRTTEGYLSLGERLFNTLKTPSSIISRKGRFFCFGRK